MNTTKIFAVVMAGIFFAAANPATAKEKELPKVTEDGLHLVPNSELAVVYADPDADLSIYKRVRLMDAYVAFKKNWKRDQKSRSADKLSVSTIDVEKIKDRLAQEFHSVFSQTLEEGGYQLVDESAEDVLLIRPAIINLDVSAPDTPGTGRSHTLSSSAGEMTLYLELYDSVTGDLIAKALDRQADRDVNQGFYTWSNSVTNQQAADRILKGWANILLEALKEAKT